LAERRLHAFLKQAWPVLEPVNPFVDNWHLQAICEHLEAVTNGQLRRLIINVPPGFCKSLSVCVFWFCWVWLRNPESRWMFTSYSEEFALRDSGKCRDLIKSDWYRSRWGDRFGVRPDQDAKGRFANDRTGFRLATSVAGGATGERADYLVADDPLKIDEADSRPAREAVNRWWDQVMSGRGADPNTSRYVVVMQRLHEKDLTGHLLEQGGYELLSIPMEFEPARRCVTPIWQDPRTEEGELAWPGRFNREAVDEWKKRLLGYGTAGQLQQRPAPLGEGAVFNPQNFRYFTEEVAGGEAWFVLRRGEGEAVRVRAANCRWFQTVDTAMKTGQQNDYTAVGTFCLTPQYDLLVYDVVREKLPMPLHYGFVLNLRQKYPQVIYQAIEDKVSGTGIIQEGALRGTPFHRLKADTDKLRRASEIATRYQNHMVFHRAGASWLADFEDELANFPKAEHDDMVDLASYAGLLAKTDALLRHGIDRDLVLWPPPRPDAHGISVQTFGDVDVVRVAGIEVVFDDRDDVWWRN
jgi:predicted phage terminase large subunit-like protein